MTLVFRFRRKKFGVEYISDERVFCQVFLILSCDDLYFLKSCEPPLNLKMLVSSNTFDNSVFFYQQLKFTWFIWVAIAVDISAKSMRPVGTQSRFTTPLTSLFPDPMFFMTVSGLDISHSFSIRDADTFDNNNERPRGYIRRRGPSSFRERGPSILGPVPHLPSNAREQFKVPLSA